MPKRDHGIKKDINICKCLADLDCSKCGKIILVVGLST
jgi:hypothetical protein